MKKRFVMLLVLIFLAERPIVLNAQDLCAFEVIDNESVGLTAAPFEKYGMAVSDIDHNGYPDIFCLRWKTPGYSRIYVNQNGIFQDITDQSPLSQIEDEAVETNTRTTLWVDYDNDGDRDLSMSTNKGIHLLRNENNTFTEVSQQVGFVGQIPPGFIVDWDYSIGGWADYDLDGDLDCIIAQVNNPNLYLFRNDEGIFIDAATEAGLDGTILAASSRLTWIDIDLDGDPDLYGSHQVFRNDNGVFSDITTALGLAGITDVGWREFFDYDNDGDFDYFKAVSDPGSAGTNEVWENRDGVFVNVTDDVGLTLSRDRYRSLTIGDFDNDGDQDIFLQLNIDPSLDVLLVNDEVAPGERAFADVAEFVGITKTGDRKGSVFFDYDRDGFLDIYLPSAEHNHILYHNQGGNNANWIGLILEGTKSNRDAIGSLVTIYTGEKKQIRYTKCGNGFVRQDNPWVHFGIGFATAVDSIVIRWPLGQKQVLTGLAINQYHEIKESDLSSVKRNSAATNIISTCLLFQNYPNPFNLSTKIAYEISQAAHVTLEVCDLTGKKLITLVNKMQPAGQYENEWNGLDRENSVLPTGVYFYRLQINDFIYTKKMILAK